MIQSVYIRADRKGWAEAFFPLAIESGVVDDLPTSFMALKGFESPKKYGGIPLIDVLNIVYKGREKVKPEDQRGSIKIFSEDGVQFVYNVDTIDDKMLTIEYLDYIPVAAKGPYWADNSCMDMRYDLFNGAYKGEISVDVDLESSRDNGVDDKVLRARNSTGEISVYVGRYLNATVANLEIRLLSSCDSCDSCASGESGESAFKNVYGVISATNNGMDFPVYASVLFAKKEGQGIDLQPDGVIPLIKTCVAVPLGHDFYLDIGLKVNGADMNGTEAFSVRKTGEFPNITRYKYKHPHIQVKVWGDVDEKQVVSKYDIVSDDYQ